MELRIDGWRCNLTFASSHFLADYSKCSRIHGHSYAVHLIMEGDAIDGILMDFRIIKSTIREIIEEIDHHVIIPTEGKFEVKREGEVEVRYEDKRYIFPEEDCIFLPIYSSSAENLATYILQEFMKRAGIEGRENIRMVKIGVDEGRGQGAWAKWERQYV